MYDFVLIKGSKIKPSTYVYLARIAYMRSMHEKKIYNRRWNNSQYALLINLLISYKKTNTKKKTTTNLLDLPNLERKEK